MNYLKKIIVVTLFLFFSLVSYSQDKDGFKLDFTFDIGNTILEINENKGSVTHAFLGVSTGVDLGSSLSLSLGLEHLTLYSDLQNDFQEFNFITVPVEVNRQLIGDNATLLIGAGLYGGYLYNVDSETLNLDDVDGLTMGALVRLGGNIKVNKNFEFSGGIRVRTSFYSDINGLDDYQQESLSPYFGLSIKI